MMQNLAISVEKLRADIQHSLEDLEQQISRLKQYSLRKAVIKKKYGYYTAAQNTLSGILHGLNEDLLDVSRAYQEWQKVQGVIELGDSITLGEITHEQTEDDTKISHQISNLRLYKSQLPENIDSMCAVVHLPIIPIFKNIELQNTAVLNSAGFNTLHFAGDDLEGYVVLAEQAILLFNYKIYNEVHLKEKEQAFQQQNLTYQAALTAYQTALAQYKQQYKVYQRHKQDNDKLAAEYALKLQRYDRKHAKYVYFCNNREKLLARYHRKLKGKTTVKDPTVKKPKKPSLPDYADLSEFQTEFKLEKPQAPQPVQQFDLTQVSNLVNALLEELSVSSGIEFMLMSNTYLKNPKNKDILCFWVVEKSKLHKLLLKYKRITVDRWGFTF